MTTKEIGEKIRLMRETRGMTQKDLAIAINKSESAVGMYEAGKRRPKDLVAEALADVFNVPKWSIYYREDEMIPAFAHMMDDASFMPYMDSDDGTPPTRTVPNINLAATKAAETLIKYKVKTTPVDPLAILQSIPNVIVVSFTEMADHTGLDRNDMANMYGAENQDAVTYTTELNGQREYIVAFNLRMPYSMLQTALARELGHIVLHHNETMPEEVRAAEALYFVRHILCPRPLIHAIQASGVMLTVETFGNITGCYGRFLAGIRRTPGASIPGNINAQVGEQFSAYVERFTSFQSMMAPVFGSALADFGTYMDNYEE